VSAAGVGYLAAFGGGLVSFASPCVLPLVPAYLSVVTGLEISEIERGPRRHLGRIARDTGLFVAGFAAVFIMLGLTATALGQALVHRQALITRISGLLVLAFALFIAGSLVLKSPLLYQARAVQGATLLAAYALGLGVPFLAAGLAFGRMAGAFGWVRRHYAAITITSACALGFFGVLLTLNRLTWVTSQLQDVMRHLGLGRLVFLG